MLDAASVRTVAPIADVGRRKLSRILRGKHYSRVMTRTLGQGGARDNPRGHDGTVSEHATGRAHRVPARLRVGVVGAEHLPDGTPGGYPALRAAVDRGEPVIGVEAALSISGGISLEGGEGTAQLTVDRLDGPRGQFVLRNLADLLAYVSFQSPVYAAILWSVGADGQQMLAAVTSNALVSMAMGVVYGYFLEYCRRLFRVAGYV